MPCTVPSCWSMALGFHVHASFVCLFVSLIVSFAFLCALFFFGGGAPPGARLECQQLCIQRSNANQRVDRSGAHGAARRVGPLSGRRRGSTPFASRCVIRCASEHQPGATLHALHRPLFATSTSTHDTPPNSQAATLLNCGMQEPRPRLCRP